MQSQREDLAMYRELRLDHIVDTTRNLQRRIEERFPGSGLSLIAGELVRVGEETGPVLTSMRRPHRMLQVAVVLVACLLIGVPAVLIVGRGLPALEFEGLGGLLQVVESAIQDIVFLSIGLYFLMTLEARLDRRVSIRELQRLRNIVHIIDMHQLTKDPEHLISHGMTTPSSPERKLNHFEMSRYLDYCTELLSLASKVAAVHVQSVNDPVVLGAVNDIENLAASLSNKIWQKIVIIDAQRRAAGILQGD